ncbi:MAG: hypothetical protein JNK04_05810 [Myxococcales bacterium]|nr:hypothetical protein [Myxococcales bacterium]
MRAFALRLGSGLLGSLSLVLVGCEDPPPPTPAGAFALQFLDSTGDCDPQTHNSGLGTVGQEGDPDLVSDGANGATISCTVEAVSGGFRVEARLNSGTDLQITVPSISTDNADEASGATGSINYASTETAGETYQSSDCKFWVNPDSQYVKAGSAWLSFVCDSINGDGDTCSIDHGFVTVKNCGGTAEEEEE